MCCRNIPNTIITCVDELGQRGRLESRYIWKGSDRINTVILFSVIQSNKKYKYYVLLYVG